MNNISCSNIYCPVEFDPNKLPCKDCNCNLLKTTEPETLMSLEELKDFLGIKDKE